MEERDVAQAAARNDGVHSRLEFRRRAGACDVLELLREQRSPVRVTPVEANALRSSRPIPFSMTLRMIVGSSWPAAGSHDACSGESHRTAADACRLLRRPLNRDSMVAHAYDLECRHRRERSDPNCSMTAALLRVSACATS